MSNAEGGNAFARRVGEFVKSEGHQVSPEYAVNVGFGAVRKKRHRFDFGSPELLVECKFYDWTDGGNNPSAKISTSVDI